MKTKSIKPNDYLKRLEDSGGFFSEYRFDINNLAEIIDFDNVKQRNLYFATLQLQIAIQNLAKALEELML